MDHHWNAALTRGVRREQLEQLRDFETADCFNDEERAVIRLAKDMTQAGESATPSGTRLSFLGQRQQLELVLTIAWYNCVVRILLPLEIEKEPWFVRN